MNNFVSSHGKNLSNKEDTIFDKLIHTFFWEELGVDLYKTPIDRETLIGFEVLQFPHKRQFISTITKEILFEVGRKLPEVSWDYNNITDGCVWYKEFWK